MTSRYSLEIDWNVKVQDGKTVAPYNLADLIVILQYIYIIYIND